MTVALFDMPLDELRGYRPERTEPDDFDQFWAATLAAAPVAGVVVGPFQGGWEG